MFFFLGSIDRDEQHYKRTHLRITAHDLPGLKEVALSLAHNIASILPTNWLQILVEQGRYKVSEADDEKNGVDKTRCSWR